VRKNTILVVVALLVMAGGLSPLAAAGQSGKAPGKGYAEGVYAEYAAATGDQILFEVRELESGRLSQLAGVSLGELIALPAYQVEASQFGTYIRNPHITTPELGALDHTGDLELTPEDFEAVGYPVKMGRYRTLLVDNRLRLAAEGWGPTLMVERAEVGALATCGFSSHPNWTAYHFYWGAYWVEYYNALGQTLVRKDLGAQQSGLRCNSSCYPAPYGYSNSSSCWGTFGWTCACDNKFGYGSTGRTGKWISETKCTHRWVNQAKASASVVNQGSASVDINWTLGGGVDSNGGQLLDTCVWY